MNFKLVNKSNIFNNYRQAQEFEKKRIAAELHDTSLQTLAHLNHQLELASLYIDKDPKVAKLEIESISKNLKNVINEIRGTIYDLRPMTFDDLSLSDAIEQHIIQVDAKSSNTYEYDIQDVDIDDEFNKLEIFRCIQELITNCEKHLESSCVKVEVYADTELHIIVSDNGKGFDIESLNSLLNNHFGLSIIEDRVSMFGGKFDINSSIGEGTTIRIDIPFEM